MSQIALHALGVDRQLVPKPFTGELLLRKVRETLDAVTAPGAEPDAKIAE